MKSLTWIALCALTFFGIACSRYTEESSGIISEGSTCRIYMKTTGIVSLPHAAETLQHFEQEKPGSCIGSTDVYVHYHFPECSREVQDYMIMYRMFEKLHARFEGRYVPRKAWGEAESWGNANCKADAVDCRSRVTPNGDIEMNGPYESGSLSSCD